jgi:hypothetical protein
MGSKGTKHIGKPQSPEGTISTQGRIKVKDKARGTIRWIDAKTGMSLDLFGTPTRKRFKKQSDLKAPKEHRPHFGTDTKK